MKTVNGDLNNYLNTKKHFQTCDLYRLVLANGSTYYIANYDVDIAWNGHLWEHRRGLFTRTQTKLSGEPTVDTMTVTICCDDRDIIDNKPILQAAHDGCFDKATLSVYKIYFDEEDAVAGGFELFEGKTEVSSAGGLKIELKVKSIIQGLASLVPIRIFAPQSAYTNVNGTVTLSSTDEATMMIPLKPSNRVLVKL